MLSRTGMPMAMLRNQAKPGSCSGPRGARTPTPPPSASPRPSRSVRAAAAVQHEQGRRAPRAGDELGDEAQPSSPRRRPPASCSARIGSATSIAVHAAGNPARPETAISTSRTSSGVTPAPSAPRTCQPSWGSARRVAVTAMRHDRAVAPAEPGPAPEVGEAERGGQLLEVRRHGPPALDRPLAQVQLGQLASALEAARHVARSSGGAASAGGFAQGRRAAPRSAPGGLVLRRQPQRLAQPVRLSSTAKPGAHGGDLEQHPARLAEVDRVEVLAVDDPRRVAAAGAHPLAPGHVVGVAARSRRRGAPCPRRARPALGRRGSST